MKLTKPSLSSASIRRFREEIYSYYDTNGRTLPWRGAKKTAYEILISEIMLQQTQVSRVLLKYPEFIRAFPTMQILARARLQTVLRVWQGMGYKQRGVR